MTRYTPTEDAQLLAWHDAGMPLKEQALRLGRTAATIAQRRRRLAARGLLDLCPRPVWRPWTVREIDQLQTLLQAGHSYDVIARRLRRTRVSIMLKCNRLGVRLLTIGGVYSAHEVADLLGVSCSKTVARWIRAGWLTATNAGTEGRPLWRISVEAVWSFMEQEHLWMAWSPEHIADRALREWAYELRAGKPQWLTIGQVAERCCVTYKAVNQWIRKGWLASQRYGNHWVREDALERFIAARNLFRPLMQSTLAVKKFGRAA